MKATQTRRALILWIAFNLSFLTLSWMCPVFLAGGKAASEDKFPSIHFQFQPIPFILDSCETPEKHAPETMAGGTAVFDYDNDGNPDIFFANGADIVSLQKTSPKYRNRLFRNNGNGTFEDVTDKAGLAGKGYDIGVAIADYDNDGYEDMFVAGVHGNTLYHNNGHGAFTDVTQRSGLNKPDQRYGPLWSVGAVWLDVNNDGLLDLFVVNYLAWDVNKEPSCLFNGKPEYCHPKFFAGLPNQLFLNNGDGTFTDISARSGIRAHPGKGMGVGMADFDGDGRPDLFVANDKMFNYLFRNLGANQFQEVAFAKGVMLAEYGDPVSGMGVESRDLNNDGFTDIVFTALQDETFPIFQNDRKGQFTEVTNRSGMSLLSKPMSGYSVNVADFDNDGWKDIFVSRGDVQSLAMAGTRQIEQPNTVFRNSQHGGWSALTTEAGFLSQPPRRHRGAAIGDFNHDGKPDVVVTALGSPAEVWINDTQNANHWIDLALQGTKSNRDGIGAKIKLTAGGLTQFNHVSTTAGYASSSAGPIHFGLAAASIVDEIEIRWPSGVVQILKHVPADKLQRITEPR
jgi:enediyne biosynthesis protein E4